MPQMSLKNAVMRLKDGGGHSITVAIGDGNLTYSEKRNIEYNLNRGKIDNQAEVREGDDVPVEVSFQYIWKYITGSGSTSTGVSISDFLTKSGGAASYTSSDTDSCRPFAVDIEVEYAPECSTGNSAETITLADFRYEELSHDMKAGTISCSGKCFIKKATTSRHAHSTGSDD